MTQQDGKRVPATEGLISIRVEDRVFGMTIEQVNQLGALLRECESQETVWNSDTSSYDHFVARYEHPTLSAKMKVSWDV